MPAAGSTELLQTSKLRLRLCKAAIAAERIQCALLAWVLDTNSISRERKSHNIS